MQYKSIKPIALFKKMKKLSFLVVAAAAMTCASCDNQGGAGNLESDIDSLSYALGIIQSQGLKDYLASMEIDTTDMKGFYSGMKEGMKEMGQKELAHFTGQQIGKQLKENVVGGINAELFGSDSTQSIDVRLFQKAFINASEGKETGMTTEQARRYVQNNIEPIRAKYMAKTYEANKTAGEKFLKANKTKEGVVTTASGLQYKVVKNGNGPKPKATDRVKVNYKGTLIDGTVFDQSPEGSPIPFAVNQVVPGWKEALQLMPVGSKWIVYVPQELGYGSRQAGPQIKPFSALIFEVELVSIENNSPAIP